MGEQSTTAQDPQASGRPVGTAVHVGVPVPELIGLLADRLGRSTAVIVHECSRCGTTLQSATADCPNCPGRRVATYRID